MKNLTPTRPKLSEAGLLKAAKMTADGVVRWADHSSINAARLANDIVSQYSTHMDGYGLAKGLDSHCGYQPDTEMVRALDSMSSHVDDIYKKEILEWMVECNITPPFPEQTAITIGLITGISTYDHACYEVLRKGDSKDSIERLIIPFENAVFSPTA